MPSRRAGRREGDLQEDLHQLVAAVFVAEQDLLARFEFGVE